jgi:regulator of replication initiation timing
LNTDQAFEMLKEAGVIDNIETFRTMLREGKIKARGFTIDEEALKRFITDQTIPNKDELIRQLKLKIKVQDEHIKGLEELLENTKKQLSKQRDQLNDEMMMLIHKKNELKQESIDLLKENIELREEIISLKDRLGNNYSEASPLPINFHHKLGLSKNASEKELFARYKELLKLAHPDRGGNPKLFQYIKMDYDQLRNNVKG